MTPATARIGLITTMKPPTLSLPRTGYQRMVHLCYSKCIEQCLWIALFTTFLISCKDQKAASGAAVSSPLSRNDMAWTLSPAVAKLYELEATIKALQSPADIKREFIRFQAGEGIWSIPREDRIFLIRYFFEAWFKKDPKDALAAISTIPNAEGGLARDVALGAGLRFSADMPEAYIEAATTLLPDSEASGILNNVYTEMFQKNPDTWFEFVQTKLGQGRTKQIAITTFFRLQVNTNFRQAVEYARQLKYEEDRRDAFGTIGSPGILPSQADLDWALSVGMPKAEIDNIRKRMHR